MPPAGLPLRVWLPAVKRALGALSPPGGRTRDVPRMTLSIVSWKRAARRAKEMPTTHTLQPESPSISSLESLGPVFTSLRVTNVTACQSMVLWDSSPSKRIQTPILLPPLAPRDSPYPSLLPTLLHLKINPWSFILQMFPKHDHELVPGEREMNKNFNSSNKYSLSSY